MPGRQSARPSRSCCPEPPRRPSERLSEWFRGRLAPTSMTSGAERPVQLRAGGPRVLTPGTPFSAHTCPGQALTILISAGALDGAAFAPGDAALEDYVVLDRSAFDEWREEEEIVMGHPHDPFGRIDVLRSSRHVVLSSGASSWPTAPGLSCTSRPRCRAATTCRGRTPVGICSRLPRAAASAPTRA